MSYTYDCLIIGAGLSGIVCGIKCASEGLRTVIFSGGRNALHFSSGSIDLYGYNSERRAVKRPFDYLEELANSNKNHPYSKSGIEDIREGLDFFKNQLGIEGMKLNGLVNENHFHVTGLGTLKPTYFSPSSVFNEKIDEKFKGRCGIAVMNFEGYRDYYAEMTVALLKKNPLFADKIITVGNIKLPYYAQTEKNLHEFRSIDLARVFDTERFLPRIAEEIKTAAGDADIVSLPAFLGIDNYRHVHERLEHMTGKLIYEVPSLPPSILGMRIDNALRARFAALAGELSNGDKVVGGEIIGSNLDHIHTHHYGDTRHRSRFYVMSTGSFFSGGLTSGFNRLEEPILKLKISGNENRSEWYSKEFFAKQSHPFLEYGVDTDENFNPFDKNGIAVKNLFCVGALLAGYNPIKEGSGGGVAVTTGYSTAKKIIAAFNGNKSA